MSHGQDHTFTYPDDLSRFPSETKSVLQMAHELGWSTRWMGTKRDMAQINSPSRDKSINIPRTNINSNRYKSWLTGIKRYSDPEKFAAWIDDNVPLMAKRVPPSVGTDPVMELHTPPEVEAALKAKTPLGDTAVARAMREAHKAATKVAAEKAIQVYDETLASQDVTPASDYVSADTTIVTTKPWMVRKGGKDGSGGSMYESPVTLERVWSDGSVDYRCKFCEYTNDNGRSVSAHASKKHKDTVGLSRQADIRHVTNYEASDIKRPMSAARRLATEITHVLDSMDDWASMDPAELAKQVADAVYEQRPDREPIAPLTPEQIISRIVGLVDRGRLADMHQTVEHTAAALADSTAARERLSQDLADAQQEVTRLREERKALRDLLADSEVSS